MENKQINKVKEIMNEGFCKYCGNKTRWGIGESCGVDNVNNFEYHFTCRYPELKKEKK